MATFSGSLALAGSPSVCHAAPCRGGMSGSRSRSLGRRQQRGTRSTGEASRGIVGRFTACPAREVDFRSNAGQSAVPAASLSAVEADAATSGERACAFDFVKDLLDVAVDDYAHGGMQDLEMQADDSDDEEESRDEVDLCSWTRAADVRDVCDPTADCDEDDDTLATATLLTEEAVELAACDVGASRGRTLSLDVNVSETLTAVAEEHSIVGAGCSAGLGALDLASCWEDEEYEDVMSIASHDSSDEMEREIEAQHYVGMALRFAKDAVENTLGYAAAEGDEDEIPVRKASKSNQLAALLKEPVLEPAIAQAAEPAAEAVVASGEPAFNAEAERMAARDLFLKGLADGSLFAALKEVQEEARQQQALSEAAVSSQPAASVEAREMEVSYTAMNDDNESEASDDEEEDLQANLSLARSIASAASSILRKAEHSVSEPLGSVAAVSSAAAAPQVEEEPDVEPPPSPAALAAVERRQLSSSRSKRRIIGGVVRRPSALCEDQEPTSLFQTPEPVRSTESRSKANAPISFRLDLGEASPFSPSASTSMWQHQRESSLSRNYEALGAEVFSLRDPSFDDTPAKARLDFGSASSGGGAFGSSFGSRWTSSAPRQMSAMMMDLGEGPPAMQSSPASATMPKVMKSRSQGFLPAISQEKKGFGSFRTVAPSPSATRARKARAADGIDWSRSLSGSCSTGQLRLRAAVF
eukprot:TRINITY_DN17881_c0_g2_i1.p1 TRINITY_DN17881_c0_g2~~TRINITY_DN17881_c0_g2_i1.p1  ORF type:complete len:700 (+),score=169.97 TRINITY_DN17881_c0_g2_i1:74-2173(+)